MPSLALAVLSALLSLPLVLPPTAVGYLLLKLLSDRGPLGGGTHSWILAVPQTVIRAPTARC